MTAGLLYLAALAVARVAASLQAYFYGTGSQALQSRVSAGIFRRMLLLPLKHHIETGTGALIQTHSHALQGVSQVTSIVCFTLLPVIVQMTVILAIVGSVSDWSVWLVLASAIIAYTFIFAFGVQRISSPSKEALDRQVDAGRWFSDALVNVETVQSLGAEGQVGGRFNAYTAAAERGWRTCYARRTETSLLATAVFLGTIAAITFLAATRISSDRMSVGDFVLLHAYAIQIVGPLESTGSALRDLAEARSYLDGWRRLLLVPVAGTVPNPPDHPAPFRADIRFENVTFSYEPERPVLTGVSLQVPDGGVVAIVGASGAGKSSLLKLLQGHYQPASGSVTISGISTSGTQIKALRQRIGVVSQDIVLFNDTLRFNLTVGASGRGDADLGAALRAARLDSLGKPVTSAHSVRSRLMDGRMRASDRLAVFVGVEAYESAGGKLLRDLFDTEAVFIDNPALLTKLAEDKLQASAGQWIEQGWSWVELQVGDGRVADLSPMRLHPEWRDPTVEEQAELDRITGEIEKLDAEIEASSADDDPRWSTRDDLEAAYEAVRQAGRVWTPEAREIAGVVLSIDRDGAISVTEGAVRVDDEKRAKALLKQKREGLASTEDDADARVTAPTTMIDCSLKDDQMRA